MSRKKTEKAAWISHQKSYRILKVGTYAGLVLTAVALLFAVAASFYNSPSFAIGVGFSILGTAMFWGSIIQAAVFFRCPYCRRPFPIRYATLPQNCPHCGKKLD